MRSETILSYRRVVYDIDLSHASVSSSPCPARIFSPPPHRCTAAGTAQHDYGTGQLGGMLRSLLCQAARNKLSGTRHPLPGREACYGLASRLVRLSRQAPLVPNSNPKHLHWATENSSDASDNHACTANAAHGITLLLYWTLTPFLDCTSVPRNASEENGR